jgi:hypothetical protein
MLWLVVTANVVPSSPILVTLMMETLRSSESSVLTGATWRHISEDGILYASLVVAQKKPQEFSYLCLLLK